MLQVVLSLVNPDEGIGSGGAHLSLASNRLGLTMRTYFWTVLAQKYYIEMRSTMFRVTAILRRS